MLKKGIKKRRIQVCSYCQSKTEPSWSDFEKLATFLTNRGRIKSNEMTGLCAKHQRGVARAIKRARYLALLPFVA